MVLLLLLLLVELNCYCCMVLEILLFASGIWNSPFCSAESYAIRMASSRGHAIPIPDVRLLSFFLALHVLSYC